MVAFQTLCHFSHVLKAPCHWIIVWALRMQLISQLWKPSLGLIWIRMESQGWLKCDQLYRVLSSLTTGESEDIVVGCANLAASGFEAWRRLSRRWYPVTAGRKRNILRAILNPDRTKTWEGVRLAVEQLDDLIRRYEA